MSWLTDVLAVIISGGCLFKVFLVRYATMVCMCRFYRVVLLKDADVTDTLFSPY